MSGPEHSRQPARSSETHRRLEAIRGCDLEFAFGFGAKNLPTELRALQPTFCCVHPWTCGSSFGQGSRIVTFEQSIVIDASASDLFRLTHDYSVRLPWDPFLPSAELLDGAIGPAVGIRSFCAAHYGLAMETEAGRDGWRGSWSL